MGELAHPFRFSLGNTHTYTAGEWASECGAISNHTRALPLCPYGRMRTLSSDTHTYTAPWFADW